MDTDSDVDTGAPDCVDGDADGLSDAGETAAGTDPGDPDSDDDGQSDGAEVALGTNPLDPAARTDGLWVAVPEGCDVEQEVTLVLWIRSVDLAFVQDTTASGGGWMVASLDAEFGQIVADLGTVVEDMAYGYATFDDYTCCGYADPARGDRPWVIRQQVTTDTDLVTAAIATTPNHYGGDSTQGTVEALFQAATGDGYDMDCDGTYDEENDVLPFLASSSDPFGETAGEWYDPTTPGGGTRGGMGFREGALPILMLGTDSRIRDPDAGSPTPGGCPRDAGSDDLVPAVVDLGATLISVFFNDTGYTDRMTDIAERTGSLADTDDDGVADDPLVYVWTGSSTEYRQTVVEAMERAIDARSFSRVALELEDDTPGFVASVEPASYADVRPGLAGTTASFTLTFHGTVLGTVKPQVFPLTLTVTGDDRVLLTSQDLSVVVPPTSP